MTEKNTRVRPANDKQVQAQIARLTTGSEKERISAAGALRETGDPRAIPILVRVSKEEGASAMVHFYASYALGQIRNPQAVPALMTALDDQGIGAFTRRLIIESLEAIGDPQAASSVIGSLKDKDTEVRIRAAAALGVWKSEAAVPALSAALKDIAAVTHDDTDDTGARYNSVTQYVCDEAATALGTIGDDRAVPALNEVWRDEKSYSHTRARAIKALGDIGGPLAVHSLIEALGSAECGKKAVKALAGIGPTAFPALLETLRHEKKRSFIIPALIEILSADEYLLPRCRAAEMLNVIAAHYPDLSLRAALPPLRRLLKRDPVFRQALDTIEAATFALSALPRPAAVPPPDTSSLPRPAEGAPLDTSVISPLNLWARLRRNLKV